MWLSEFDNMIRNAVQSVPQHVQKCGSVSSPTCLVMWLSEFDNMIRNVVQSAPEHVDYVVE